MSSFFKDNPGKLEELIRLRKAGGKTQDQIGDILGCTANTIAGEIGRIRGEEERNGVPPSQQTFPRIRNITTADGFRAGAKQTMTRGTARKTKAPVANKAVKPPVTAAKQKTAVTSSSAKTSTPTPDEEFVIAWPTDD